MTDTHPTADPLVHVRWCRRVTGGLVLLVLAFWIYMLGGHLISGERSPNEMENIPWTEYARGPGLLTVCVLAVIWAWWRPLVGGAALIVCAVAVAIAMSPTSPSAYLFVGGPFLLVGLLSVAYGRMIRKATGT
jgi:hypothetical protein